MTSLPLSLSTRQSVSPGPRIIVTLTGFFVDQSLILIKKKFFFLGLPCGSAGKESAAVRETWVWSLSWEDPLEKGKAAHSSILAWRIPWTV